MKRESFRTGAGNELRRPRVCGPRRIGLVSHLAATNPGGATTAALLASRRTPVLAAIFSPEHGFFGAEPAGRKVTSSRHPWWGIPVHSLHGEHRKPTADMLRDLDELLVDFQDLATRCYTYVSTLRLVLEAAAEAALPVRVLDRPVPLPCTTDGPLLDPACESFVGMIPAPLAYGMTPGETALWLRDELGLHLDLQVRTMAAYRRDAQRGPDWPPWVPPSPGIITWEAAIAYPATVCFEALPAVDHGRGTPMPFQVLGAPWIHAPRLAGLLNKAGLPGVVFHPHQYIARTGAYDGMSLPAVRLTVTEPRRFLPVSTAVHLLHTLQREYGVPALWKTKGTRPDFFDKLMGTPAVRESLLDGAPPGPIVRAWKPGLDEFRRKRQQHLLYKEG